MNIPNTYTHYIGIYMRAFIRLVFLWYFCRLFCETSLSLSHSSFCFLFLFCSIVFRMSCPHEARSGFAVKRKRYTRICVNINVKFYCKYAKCKWTLDTFVPFAHILFILVYRDQWMNATALYLNIMKSPCVVCTQRLHESLL